MAKVDNYLLGMDCGTTNIKAIILGEDGTVVAEASRPSKSMPNNKIFALPYGCRLKF